MLLGLNTPNKKALYTEDAKGMYLMEQANNKGLRNYHVCTSEARIDNIERVMEKMATNMERMTEIYIKQATLETRIANIAKNSEDHEKRLRVVTQSVDSKEMLHKWVERIVWVVILGGIFYLQPGVSI